jgi:endonuclease/exonuclease/phosphatase (EEP) superfamily protein YafD
MTPPTSKPVLGFWRCSACDTPNPTAAYLTKCLGCGRPIPPFSNPEPASVVAKAPEKSGRRGRFTLILGAIYASIVIASVGMIRGMSLGWWLVATLLFMPRWLFLLPIAPLMIGAIRSRRLLVSSVVVADLLLVLGPLMGFVVPVSRIASSTPVGSKVRVMTLNQGTRGIDASLLIRYLDRQKVDVVCLQEPDSRSGLDERFLEAGWKVDRARRFASRYPIVKEYDRSPGESKSADRRPFTFFQVKLRHPDGFDFLVGSIHMPTPRRAFSLLFRGDFDGFRENLGWWDEEIIRLREVLADSGRTPLIVGGDFNMPSDYHRMKSLRSTYSSAYDQTGWGFGYTRPTSLPWVRIDHVIANRNWSFTKSWVGPDLGSDHLPLIAEAVLIDGKPAD